MRSHPFAVDVPLFFIGMMEGGARGESVASIPIDQNLIV
jgi:hypothetical protein